LTEGPESITFYRPECFALLGQWLALATEHPDATGAGIERQAAVLSPHLASFLATVGLPEVWERLQRHNGDRRSFIGAFHGWFDAFKTLKLIHHLAAGPFPRCHPEDALPQLLQQAGAAPVAGVSGQLMLLRRMQNGPAACGNDPDCPTSPSGRR
jgi:hypothetical protein